MSTEFDSILPKGDFSHPVNITSTPHASVQRVSVAVQAGECSVAPGHQDGADIVGPRLVSAGSARPLFIPLKREYYDCFAARTKNVEFRPFGPRWNFGTCQIGRRVVLSLGYGTAHRLTGVVQSFRIASESERKEIPGWRDCYGADPRPIACIGIHVQDSPNDTDQQRRVTGTNR